VTSLIGGKKCDVFNQATVFKSEMKDTFQINSAGKAVANGLLRNSRVLASAIQMRMRSGGAEGLDDLVIALEAPTIGGMAVVMGRRHSGEGRGTGRIRRVPRLLRLTRYWRN
jgi:hypothetical protein